MAREVHHRLGFSQGGIADITGREGLFLIREVGGTSTTLVHWADSFWIDDEVYGFAIERAGGALTVSVQGRVRSTPGMQGATREDVINPQPSVSTLSGTVNDSSSSAPVTASAPPCSC